jgi:RimJ/RimL family protein N-acetyltransferase
MLATDPERRGQKLALILGALAMQQMHQRFGFASFMTGVQPGNAPSEAVCRASGLQDRGRAILTVVDSAVLPGGKLTS